MFGRYARLSEAFGPKEDKQIYSLSSDTESLKKDTDDEQDIRNVSFQRKSKPVARYETEDSYPRQSRGYRSNVDHVDSGSSLGMDGGGSSSRIEDTCLYLISQVLRNDKCKTILRNILLEEYISRNMNLGMTYNPMLAPSTSNALIEGFSNFTSGTIYGLDVRTVMILILISIVVIYFYDVITRIFSR